MIYSVFYTVDTSLEKELAISKSELITGMVIWFTGLPCSGKTTLTELVSKRLRGLGESGVKTIDGDTFRATVSSDLAFSRDDRDKNVERLALSARTLSKHGATTLVAAVSPYRDARQTARETIGNDHFIEAYCNAPLAVCEQRDVKGLYSQARQGLIENFTGISDPYEHPINPELTLNTATASADECAEAVVTYLQSLLDERKYSSSVDEPIFSLPS